MPSRKIYQRGEKSVALFGDGAVINVSDSKECCSKSQEWKIGGTDKFLLGIAVILEECRSRDRILMGSINFPLVIIDCTPKSEDCFCFKLAEGIVNAESSAAFNTIASLRGVLSKDRCIDVLHLFTPLWVKRDDAEIIKRCASDSNAQKRSVGLNTKEHWTVNCYISRAYDLPFKIDHPIIEIAPPMLQENDVEAQINEHFRRKELDPSRVLNGFERRGKPFFALFSSASMLDKSLLEKLRNSFAYLTFFIMTSGSSEGNLQCLNDLVTQLPGLDPDAERELHSLYESTLYELS